MNTKTPETDAKKWMAARYSENVYVEVVDADFGCKLERERDEARKERNELNNLLRSVGWGQGEIDSAASFAEENDALIAERDQLRKVCDELAKQLKPFAECISTCGGQQLYPTTSTAISNYNSLPHVITKKETTAQ